MVTWTPYQPGSNCCTCDTCPAQQQCSSFHGLLLIAKGLCSMGARLPINERTRVRFVAFHRSFAPPSQKCCRACPSSAFTSKARHYNVSISFREKGTDLFSRSCLRIRAIPVAKSAIMNHNLRILGHLNAIVCIACRERMAQLARLRRITLR